MIAPAIGIVAVDGGNSKTDVALLAEDGRLLGAARGGGSNHQGVGLEAAVSTIVETISAAADDAGLDAAAGARLGVFCLAGADLPTDDRRLGRALAATGVASRLIVRNDAFAGLRAGSASGWGIGITAGAGLNCVAIGPDGRRLRFPALGALSGDAAGGGDGIGQAALGAAIRARDGRGPRTVLETSVPACLGASSPYQLMLQLYEGRLDEGRLGELAPVVFAAAREHDAVARGIIDRVADETVAMIVAAARRLRLIRRPVDVVLAGGLFQADDAAFVARITAGTLAGVTHARVVVSVAPPVVGAALLGIDELGLPPDATTRLRGDLTAARLSRGDPRRAAPAVSAGRGRS